MSIHALPSDNQTKPCFCYLSKTNFKMMRENGGNIKHIVWMYFHNSQLNYKTPLEPIPLHANYLATMLFMWFGWKDCQKRTKPILDRAVEEINHHWCIFTISAGWFKMCTWWNFRCQCYDTASLTCMYRLITSKDFATTENITILAVITWIRQVQMHPNF